MIITVFDDLNQKSDQKHNSCSPSHNIPVVSDVSLKASAEWKLKSALRVVLSCMDMISCLLLNA